MGYNIAIRMIKTAKTHNTNEPHRYYEMSFHKIVNISQFHL